MITRAVAVVGNFGNIFCGSPGSCGCSSVSDENVVGVGITVHGKLSRN